MLQSTLSQVLLARKTALRRELRLRRAALDDAQNSALSAQIGARVLVLLEQQKLLEGASRIAIYLANASEVNLDALIEKLQARGVEVLAPHFEDEACAFYPLAPRGENIVQVAWGRVRLRAPAAYSQGAARSTRELDAILVPGLGFDLCGNRIGQGGGWYDRVLAGAPTLVKIGVAFDFQLAKDLPHEPHDQRMDFVVTEKQIVKANVKTKL
jgi:5-formyltetrahydrofolate cyclo-ligase